MSKKAMETAVLVAILMTAAVLVVIFIVVFGPIMDVVKMKWSGDECTGSFESMSASQYRTEILRFSSVTREDGAPNELYEPGYAVRLFATYTDCRDKKHKFTETELKTEDPLIMTSAKAAYVSRAEQLCGDWCEAQRDDPTDSEGAAKDILKSHTKLSKEYKQFFGGEPLPGTACKDSCTVA